MAYVKLKGTVTNVTIGVVGPNRGLVLLEGVPLKVWVDLPRNVTAGDEVELELPQVLTLPAWSVRKVE